MNDDFNRKFAAFNDVTRERLTTVDIVHRRHFSGLSPDAARKALDSMVEQKLLRKIPLHGQVPCYILTFTAATKVKLHRVAAKVPGFLALCRAYALACYSARSGARRFSLSEWRQVFADLHRDGLPAHSFFLENRDGDTRIVLGVVDAGQDVRRLSPGSGRRSRSGMPLPAFAEAIQNDRFEVVVLTPTEGEKGCAREGHRPALQRPHAASGLRSSPSSNRSSSGSSTGGPDEPAAEAETRPHVALTSAGSPNPAVRAGSATGSQGPLRMRTRLHGAGQELGRTLHATALAFAASAGPVLLRGFLVLPKSVIHYVILVVACSNGLAFLANYLIRRPLLRDRFQIAAMITVAVVGVELAVGDPRTATLTVSPRASSSPGGPHTGWRPSTRSG